jgi:hypothetical protein
MDIMNDNLLTITEISCTLPVAVLGSIFLRVRLQVYCRFAALNIYRRLAGLATYFFFLHTCFALFFLLFLLHLFNIKYKLPIFLLLCKGKGVP